MGARTKTRARRADIMRIGTSLLIGFGLLAIAGAKPADRPVAYESFKLGKAVYHTVRANLKIDQVTVETQYAPRLTGSWSMIGRTQPVAAITGTFFAYENHQPVADVIVDGELVASGHRGTALAVDWFGRVHIFDAGFRQPVDWFPYRYALRGTVRLVKDGDVCPNPRAQAFRDSRIWGRAARTAVGLTKEGKLVLMATPNSVTLTELGKAMVSRGVKQAVSLDGGGSTMLYYRGSMVVSPNRPLSTMLILHERSPFDSAYRRHTRAIAASR